MDKVAEQILSCSKVSDEAGIEYPLHSNTPREQCELLQQVIRQVRPRVSIETGLAYGVSTLFICEALREVNAERHIVIDRYQHQYWHSIGLLNLKNAGYESLVDFRPQFAHQVLPDLLREGTRVDFAYLDASKCFDVVLVNVYYLIRLLNIGGVVVLDDCNWPGVRKVCRLLAKHPSLQICLTWGPDPPKPVVEFIGAILRWVPKGRRMFAPAFVDSDKDRGIDAKCIGFRKVAEDTRKYDWFEDF